MSCNGISGPVRCVRIARSGWVGFFPDRSRKRHILGRLNGLGDHRNRGCGFKASAATVVLPAGRDEVIRRFRAGEGDIAIGRAMGINRETVRRIRKELPPMPTPHQTGIEDVTG